MTEASERIYNEVGEDAEIIWGAVIDDSLGDEMRVTVIATGIGAAPEVSVPTRHSKVRTLKRPEKVVNYEEPAFLRKKTEQLKEEPLETPYGAPKGMNVDETDLDIPTFLRKKAD